jgi:hypothetical protein
MLIWTDATHVALGRAYVPGCPPMALDVVRGRASRLSTRAWQLATCRCRSADGQRIVDVVRRRSRFAIRVSRTSGGAGRILATVPTCPARADLDLKPTPAVEGLHFAGDAVVYATACRSLPSHLYLGASGSGRLRRVTSLGTHATQPVPSPDGRHIAYVEVPLRRGSVCGECDAPIRVMDADGTHPRSVTPVVPYASFRSWSPDGRQILFDSGRQAENGDDIWSVASLDGSKPVDLPFLKWSPTWIPGGFAYAYSNEIWTVRADGSDARVVARTPGDQDIFDLAAGPGGRLAWIAGETLHVAAVDGTGARTIPAQEDAELIGWSQDGRLAWTEGTSLRVLRGTSVRRIRLPFAAVTSIAWSSGDSILLTGARYPGAPFEAYAVAADGSGVRRLTTGLGANGAGWLR